MGYFKNICFVALVFLANLTYAINSIDNINYLYDNNIEEFEKRVGNRQAISYSLILADYLEKAPNIQLVTVRYLVTQKTADLSYLVAKASSGVFTDSQLLPHKALVRLIKERKFDIIKFLIDRADALNVEREFFFVAIKMLI